MKLTLKRIFRGKDYTIGHLYLDDIYQCDTLEDTCRIENLDCSMKIYGKTAIPEGTYNIGFVWWEKHKNTYPKLYHVPCFEGILIHSGTDALDTEGCILLGRNKIKGGLIDSKICWNDLMSKIKDDKKLSIEIL